MLNYKKTEVCALLWNCYSILLHCIHFTLLAFCFSLFPVVCWGNFVFKFIFPPKCFIYDLSLPKPCPLKITPMTFVFLSECSNVHFYSFIFHSCHSVIHRISWLFRQTCFALHAFAATVCVVTLLLLELLLAWTVWWLKMGDGERKKWVRKGDWRDWRKERSGDTEPENAEWWHSFSSHIQLLNYKIGVFILYCTTANS